MLSCNIQTLANVRSYIAVDNTVSPPKIKATNTPTDNDILVYQAAEFKWEDGITLNGTLNTKKLVVSTNVLVTNGNNVGIGTATPSEIFEIVSSLTKKIIFYFFSHFLC